MASEARQTTSSSRSSSRFVFLFAGSQEESGQSSVVRHESSLLSLGGESHEFVFGLVRGDLVHKFEVVGIVETGKAGFAGVDEEFVESSSAFVSRG